MTSIALNDYVYHAGTVRSTEPLTVESPPERWSYTVAIQITAAEHPSKPVASPLNVATTVTVHNGQLGCLLVGDDWTTLRGALPPTVGVGSHTVDLLLDNASGPAYLVFRNNGPGRQPCVFTIESVVLSEAKASKWSPTIDEVVDASQQCIDVAKLRDSFTNRQRMVAPDSEILDALRRKWATVPAGRSDGKSTAELLALSDHELRQFWTSTHHEATTEHGLLCAAGTKRSTVMC